MLHCLLRFAVRAVALVGANEDIGVEKGGRDVMSKPYAFPFGSQRPVTTVLPVARSKVVAMSVLSTSPALLLETSDWFYIFFLHRSLLVPLSHSVIGNLVLLS
jgi:hypothetical protein